MTVPYFGILLKLALERSGLDARTILTLGYRDRIIYPDIEAKLNELNRRDLLYTRSRQRGVYIIPSLVRPDSFDLVLINMAMGEATDFIDSGLIDTLSEQGRRDLKGLYL